MIRKFAAAGFACFALAAAPAFGLESPEDAAFAKEVFGKAPGDKPAAACFTRTYNAAHLLEHPKQNVRTMRMLVTTENEDNAGRTYGLRLGVGFRKAASKFETGGSCGSIHHEGAPASEAGIVHCGVDCDGGAIDVALRDAKSLRVSIPDGARLWQAGSSDDENPSGRRKFGADDKLFRLDRANIRECLPLITDADDRKRFGIAR